MNEELLNEATALRNVHVFFRHKVTSADFDERIITLRNLDSNKELSVDFDFCIGADGSYSVIRRQMMRVVRWVFFLETCLRSRKNFTSFPFGTFGFARMDYQQEYIKHEYVELKMPAGRDSEGKSTFLLDPNHLHIWPRHSFMLIALPNKVIQPLLIRFRG